MGVTVSSLLHVGENLHLIRWRVLFRETKVGMNQMAMPIRGEEQSEQWQTLLDSAGEGIWALDMEGNCTFVNRMAANIFGFANEELVGFNMHELVHHHFYPDDRRYPDSECPISSGFRCGVAGRRARNQERVAATVLAA